MGTVLSRPENWSDVVDLSPPGPVISLHRNDNHEEQRRDSGGAEAAARPSHDSNPSIIGAVTIDDDQNGPNQATLDAAQIIATGKEGAATRDVPRLVATTTEEEEDVEEDVTNDGAITEETFAAHDVALGATQKEGVAALEGPQIVATTTEQDEADVPHAGAITKEGVVRQIGATTPEGVEALKGPQIATSTTEDDAVALEVLQDGAIMEEGFVAHDVLHIGCK